MTKDEEARAVRRGEIEIEIRKRMAELGSCKRTIKAMAEEFHLTRINMIAMVNEVFMEGGM